MKLFNIIKENWTKSDKAAAEQDKIYKSSAEGKTNTKKYADFTEYRYKEFKKIWPGLDSDFEVPFEDINKLDKFRKKMDQMYKKMMK